jgi:hypothetical protein
MSAPKSNYYAEIQILVDGWPWNRSEFDFRSWSPVGKWPRGVDSPEIVRERQMAALAIAVSENRRATIDRRKEDRRRSERRKASAG